MLFTDLELRLSAYALTRDTEKNAEGAFLPRYFEKDDQEAAGEVYSKIMDTVNEETNEFPEEVELELGTKEKALLLEMLDRELHPQDIKAALALRAKLEA